MAAGDLYATVTFTSTAIPALSAAERPHVQAAAQPSLVAEPRPTVRPA